MNPKLVSVVDPFQIHVRIRNIHCLFRKGRCEASCLASVNQLAVCGTWPACDLYLVNSENHLVAALAESGQE